MDRKSATARRLEAASVIGVAFGNAFFHLCQVDSLDGTNQNARAVGEARLPDGRAGIVTLELRIDVAETMLERNLRLSSGKDRTP